MESDRLSYMCALSRVFAYKCSVGRRLLDSFGDVRSLFEAGRDGLSARLSGGREYIDRLLDPQLLEWAQREVEWAARYGIALLPIGDPRYPRRLAECGDAPLVLYCKGDADLNASRVLAVVGTRKASWYGREGCRRIVERLSDLEIKPLIVSGMALGIDGAAHEAALSSGLQTVGVLPCGLDEIYPRQHRGLACRILGEGALVTDFPRRTSPVAFTFLRRNRIIAGMSDAVLLAESYRKGGGLITASLAESYDREVFALPGRLTDASFEGCNHLIARRDAILAEDAEAIALAMGWEMRKSIRGRRTLLQPGDPPKKRELLRLLESRSPLSAEDAARLTGLEAGEVTVLLLELEMEGRAVADGNKFFLSL